jgi:hypothetical protein
MLQIVHAHAVTVLTETRESKERLAFLKGMLPNNIFMYSSRLDQHKGGVAVFVQARFLQHFDGQPKWTVFTKGRIARLEFRGASGRLHVYAIYLSPDSPEEREQQLKQLVGIIDPKVHNILAGDFNFVTNDCDRISKVDGEGHSDAADRRNAVVWKGLADTHDLREFQQEEFTCENSYGWSKIDRIYTNLHAAELCSMKCACNLLPHPRQLSDHRPVSVVMSPMQSQNRRKAILIWVTEHALFKEELNDEFAARCDAFARFHGVLPDSFEKLKLLKESAHRVSSFIRRLSRTQIAETLEHKLAVGMAFLRAVRVQDLRRAEALQQKCVELQHLAISAHLANSQEYERVKDLIVEWMRSDIQARADELREVRQKLPEVVYQQRKKGILSSIKQMLPAGSGDIAAMIDDNGNIVTETSEIARVLNTYWQHVFESLPTVISD